tara:strand:- start:3 stop:386 length:384 start_codon:yes stop_codon:yes gene_type:complete
MYETMKSILISPDPGQYCSDDFIKTIYDNYNPDFAKCFYNNISAVASWEGDSIPSNLNVTGVLINSTRDNVGNISHTTYVILLILAGAILAVGIGLCGCICFKDRSSKKQSQTNDQYTYAPVTESFL